MDIKRSDLQFFSKGARQIMHHNERTRLGAMLIALIFVFVITSGQAQSGGTQTEAAQEEAMTTINIQIPFSSSRLRCSI
jgi:hypothetical protein